MATDPHLASDRDGAREVVFCHGLESGPHGRKFAALAAAGLPVTAPDCRGLALAARVAELTRQLAARAVPPVVVGSSYGGLAAVLAAMDAPVHALVLCAPSLGRREPPASDRALVPAAPTVIIHGTRDEVVPIGVSRAFARHADVRLLEVDDDHRLTRSLPLIVAQTRMALAPTPFA